MGGPPVQGSKFHDGDESGEVFDLVGQILVPNQAAEVEQLRALASYCSHKFEYDAIVHQL